MERRGGGAERERGGEAERVCVGRWCGRKLPTSPGGGGKWRLSWVWVGASFFLFDEMFFCRRLNLLHVKMEMSPMKMIFVGLCVHVVLPLMLRKLFLAAYRKTIFLVKARRKRSPWQRSRYAGVAIWRAHASNETGARARLAPLHAFFPLFLCFFLTFTFFFAFFLFFRQLFSRVSFFSFSPIFLIVSLQCFKNIESFQILS